MSEKLHREGWERHRRGGQWSSNISREDERTPADSIVPMTAGRSSVRCEKVQLRVVIDDPARWRARVGRVLEAGRRRWLGRCEPNSSPALQRWNGIEPPGRPAGHATLGTVVAAAAAGVRPPGTDLTDFATAIMLLAECPAIVTGRVGGGDRPGVLTISLFAFPADDLALAQDLAEVTVATAGVVTYRSKTRSALAGTYSDDRIPFDAKEIPPLPGSEVHGPVRAPAELDGIGG